MSNSTSWKKTAFTACLKPERELECPSCGQQSISAEWNVIGVSTRDAVVDLNCRHCGVHEKVQIELPKEASAFWPMKRRNALADIIDKQVDSLMERILQHASTMPAAEFVTDPLWCEAGWNASTFQWHPMSEAPPLMGLVFENEEAGLDIFRSIEDTMNHEDRFEEIRISIIEGAVPGQEHRPGYSVHLCADPEALEAHATFDEFVVDRTIVPFLGQWNRHYPVPGQPSLLAKFKEEFEKHQEFMLAPTVLKDDGNRYMVPELGIIKNLIHFRQLSDITTPDDPDAAALMLPELIVPPT